MVGVAILAVILTLSLPKDIFTRVLFAWVALGAAFGPTILVKCLGFRVKGGFALAAIIVGIAVAVTAYNIPGPVADIFEKWISWALGLAILFAGRKSQLDE